MDVGHQSPGHLLPHLGRMSAKLQNSGQNTITYSVGVVASYWLVAWQWHSGHSVGLPPANFPCPALDLQLMGGH